MRRMGVVAFACLAVGFGAGLLAAPALRSPPAVAVDRVHREPARDTATGMGRARSNQEEMARLALAAASLERTARAPRLHPVPGANPATGPSGNANVDNERPVTLEQLPPAIRATVTQIVQGRQLRDLTLELRTHEGKPLFETEFVLDGAEHELKMDEQGKILESEVQFALGDLPTPVTTGIAAAMPGAVLLDAEREQDHNDPAHFEINIRHAGQRYELQVAEDGRVLRTQAR